MAVFVVPNKQQGLNVRRAKSLKPVGNHRYGLALRGGCPTNTLPLDVPELVGDSNGQQWPGRSNRINHTDTVNDGRFVCLLRFGRVESNNPDNASQQIGRIAQTVMCPFLNVAPYSTSASSSMSISAAYFPKCGLRRKKSTAADSLSLTEIPRHSRCTLGWGHRLPRASKDMKSRRRGVGRRISRKNERGTARPIPV